MSSVTLHGASKTFGDFTAVREMDLAIENGEFVAILGPSGCGKTTTMNMIAGIEDVTRGSIVFDDRDVTNVPVQNRGVGFVFQNYAIFTHMTVRQNLAFGLEVQGVAPGEVDRRVGEMAEFMALSPRIDQPSSGLSVNEMQKLAIGRSAIVEPSIFLLDEPLSNLDAAFREKMRAELKGLQRALKQTMVYVTHDQIEAMGLADRIAVMNHAVLQQFDTPTNIYARPANVFVARFMGAPSMNIVPARICDGGVIIGAREAGFIALSDRDTATLKASASKDILIGFRPEELAVTEPGAAGSITANVALVEKVGRRKIVHLLSGETAFLAVTERGLPVLAGDAVGIKIDPAKVHLFDLETEMRLEDREGAANG